MNHQIAFWLTFTALVAAIFFFDFKYGMLRDTSTGIKPQSRPYSFSSVQLAWWTVIVLTSFITTILVRGQIPTLNDSMLVLLGISTGTTAIAKVIDLGDIESRPKARHQNSKSEGLVLDILSDEKGISLQRFQALILNLTFGFWFIYTVLENLALSGSPLNTIIPAIENNNLILLGLSSATYAAFKSTENRVLAAMKGKQPSAGEDSTDVATSGGGANTGKADKDD